MRAKTKQETTLHPGYLQLVRRKDLSGVGERHAMLYRWRTAFDNAGNILVDLYCRSPRLEFVSPVWDMCRMGIFNAEHHLIMIPPWPQVIKDKGSSYTVILNHWDPDTGLFTTQDTAKAEYERAREIFEHEGLTGL